MAPLYAEGSREARPARLGALGVALLLTLSVLPYLNGLGGDFTYDDKPIVRDNARIASPSTAREVFTTHYFGGSFSTATNYRPLLLLSYGVERWLHGNRPLPFHLVNIALHAGVTLLLAVWLLALRFPRGPVLAGAALFAVVPIHVEAVTSIVGRAESLAALLVLGAAILWLRATEGERLRRGPYFGALGLFLAAVFVKENAVVVPGVIGLGELFRDGRGDAVAAKVRALSGRWRLAFLGLFIPVLILFAVRRLVLEGFLVSRQASIFDLENALVAMKGALRAANATGLLLRYASKTLWPTGLSADHSARALDLASSLAEPRAILPVVALTLLAGAVLLLWRRRPLFAFGILFFLGTFLPASNILFPIGTIYAERLAYLPSAGLLVAVTALFEGLPFAVPRPARIRWKEIALALAVAGYGAATVQRNRVWANDGVLFAETVRAVPRSGKARYNYAYHLSREKRIDEARTQLEAAVANFPRHYEAWGFLGKIAWDAKSYDEALRCYRRSVEIHPAFEFGLWGLARTLEESGRFDEARAAFDAGVRALPESYPIAYHRASFFAARGNLERSEREWRRALITGRDAPAALLEHAKVLERLGRRDDAAKEARRGLAADPKLEEATRLLERVTKPASAATGG